MARNASASFILSKFLNGFLISIVMNCGQGHLCFTLVKTGIFFLLQRYVKKARVFCLSGAVVFRRCRGGNKVTPVLAQ